MNGKYMKDLDSIKFNNLGKTKSKDLRDNALVPRMVVDLQIMHM